MADKQVILAQVRSILPPITEIPKNFISKPHRKFKQN